MKKKVLPDDYNYLAQTEAEDQALFDELSKIQPLSTSQNMPEQDALVNELKAVDTSAQQPVIPSVKDYLVGKYNLSGKFSDANREKVLEESKVGMGEGLMAALSALGAGIQGKDAGSAGMSSLNMMKNAKQQKVDEFDKARAMERQDLDYARQQDKLTKDDELAAREADPNSEESRLAQELAKKMLPSRDFSGMTAAQINKQIPSLQKIYDIEQRKLDREAARQASADARSLAREEKAAKEAKLSDKQIGELDQFDQTINQAQSTLASLGDNSSWVGPVDGRIPDVLVSADQVGFRSAIGRMADAYRKLITGAGASNQELARLEGRLPQPTDTLADFKAKALSLINETKKARDTKLQSFERGGKNVGEFRDSETPAQEETKTVNGKKYRRVQGGWEEV